MAVLRGLLNHKDIFKVSVLLRASTVNKGPDGDARLAELKSLGIESFVAGDIQEDSDTSLASTFAEFDIVVGCTGFLGGPGTQTKLARCAIEASDRRQKEFRYVPWQFGVDYDILSHGKSLGLFDEQCSVRDLLRSRASSDRLSWTIVSTGIFTSFLFEDAFGVVERQQGGAVVIVRALGDWDVEITTTTVEDIGTLTSAALRGFDESRNRVVFVAGETISYGRLADVVEGHLSPARVAVQRERWDLELLLEELKSHPDDALRKYRIIFGGKEGIAWPASQSYNAQTGTVTWNVSEWLQKRQPFA
ncbi:hypothetical protein L7F22_018700 [Adiantum nelumboides]|nr:hypothetical protein [Adiantum nelumboides]